MAINFSNNRTVIDSGTKLVIKTGNQGTGKVLVSDSDGLVDWVGVKGLVSQDRYIGELYGGGIVVNIWQEGNEECVLIASLEDVSATNMSGGFIGYVPPKSTRWSPQTATLKGATSFYDGRSNNQLARAGINLFTFDQSSNAINFDGYGGMNGYSDWYLPSIFEMRAIWSSAAVINKVLGEHNFKFGVRDGVSAKYWTSTECSDTLAWILDLTATESGNFALQLKTNSARMRPVRLERKSAGNGLTTYLDATEKRSYSDSALANRWVDLANSGLTSSYSFTFSSTNNTGPTYSTDFGGFLKFNGSSYVDLYTPIGGAGTVTIEMWCRLNMDVSGTNNYMLFGWNLYSVYVQQIYGLNFTTGGGYFWGLTPSQVTDLGLIGNWKHYVFEMRSDVNSNNNRMWINGVLQTLTQTSSENAANRNFNGGLGRIGGYRYRDDAYFAFCDISVFRVYKRALTQAEVLAGYNKYRRKYEIGVTSTHNVDLLGSGTFSIDQNVKMNIPGKKNQRVLRSSANGTASWVDKNYLFYRPDNKRFVGELYAGGIIVSVANYPTNVFNYLIMSTKDLNEVVGELRYGGNQQTRITWSYNLSGWLGAGQTVRFQAGGSQKNLTMDSVFFYPTTFNEGNSGTNLNLAIPDSGTVGVPSPTALVAPAYFVTAQFVPTVIEVQINISHTWIADLAINLVSPAGKVINLFNRTNGSADNMTNTTFTTDLSAPSITTATSPHTGTFRMSAGLGVTTGAYTSNAANLTQLLDGKTMNGNWFIVVHDLNGTDPGTLINYSLTYTGIRTVATVNETLATSTVYESNKTFVIGATGLSVPWGNNQLFTQTTNYDGATNSFNILNTQGKTHSAALLCDMYNADGFGDWYLPSSLELVNAFDALAAVNYVFGTQSMGTNLINNLGYSRYWTSDYLDQSNAVCAGVGGGVAADIATFLGSFGVTTTALQGRAKSERLLVRGFRKVSVLANTKTWGSADPTSEPTGDWYTEAWDEKNWKSYPRVTKSNLIFDFRTDNVFCYNGRFNGFSTSAQSRVGSQTGSVFNGATWSSDEHAIQFSSYGQGTNVPANANLVRFGQFFAVQPQPPLSFEFWIKPMGATVSNIYPILTSHSVLWTSSAPPQYGFTIEIQYQANEKFDIRFQIASGGIPFGPTMLVAARELNMPMGSPYYATPINRGVWNHVVITYNGTTNIKFYANNQPYDTWYSPSGGATPSTINGTGSAGALAIGARFNSAGGLDAFVSCVRIYNKILTPEEIKNNYEYDRVRYDL